MEVLAMISDWKCVAPLELLAQILSGDDELKFVESQTVSSPPPSPLVPAVETHDHLMETDLDYAKEFNLANSLPLPDDDDDDL
jgi:hypothetical protein